MQRTNLLYIITKLELGGAQKQLLTLIRQLDQAKFNPFLFTAKEGLLLTDALSIEGLKVEKSRFLERTINPLRDIAALWEIYRFIKQNDIRIVHTHSSKAGILGRLAAGLAQVKLVIHTVHGWPFHEYQLPFWRAFFIWLERLAAKFTQKIVVVSCHDKEKGLRSRIGSHNQYILIRYGIDYKEFEQTDQGGKEGLGIEPGDLVVANTSCFKPQKSPRDFIKLAFLVNKVFPRAKFILVGDGALRASIERLIARLELQDRVILLGWRRDVPSILSVSDIFVLTSLWEGLPVSVLEAMASSKTVVATDTGGVREVITDSRTGFLVAPGDMQRMSERLVRLLQNESLRRTMGNNAKSSLGFNFCVENMARDNQLLYENLISGEQNGNSN